MDPLSLAASVAGLITLVGKAAEISRELYNAVKRKHQPLERLADDLEAFQGVLGDLDSRLADGSSVDERGALETVSASCERTVQELQDRLTSLRDMFSKNRLSRLRSRSRFEEIMSDVVEMRRDLEAFKLTLSIALHVRVIKQTRNLATAADFDHLRVEMKELTSMTEKLRTSQALHPIQQYLDIGASVLGNRKADLASASNPPGSTQPNATDDMENVRSFGSFEDWLNSFSPDQPSQSAITAGGQAAAKIARPVRSTLSKNATIRLSIRGLSPSATAEFETIELAMTDYFYSGIDALRQRGYKDVCGFRVGSQLLGPMTELTNSVPVYVTDGPSSYPLDWLEINRDEPLREFYDSFIRTEDKRNALDVSIRDNKLNIRDTYLDTTTSVSLDRTLRLPEDGVTYNLPALFGPFPLINVDFLRGKLPEAMVQKSGVVIPVYQREAISINFHSSTPRTAVESLAIRVLSGGVNVISGLPADDTTDANRQDYVTSPAQRRLDGFLSAPKGGRGVVRQFVAMPIGEGYAVEGQVTGSEVINGIQLIIAPPFVAQGEFSSDEATGPTPLAAQEKSPASLGLEPGTWLRMSGKDIWARFAEEHAEFAEDMLHAPGQSFIRYKSRSGLSSMRPLRTHEVLRSILEQCGQFQSLVLEPVFAITVTIQKDPMRSRSPEPTLVTWRLSPFMPVKRLYMIVETEFDLRETGDVRLLCGPYNLQRDGGHLLHDVCVDRAVITIKYVLQDLPLARGAPPPNARDMPRTPPENLVSGWEMGLAPGGKIYQDVYVDMDPGRWNWRRSQLLNIQILNSAAFKSFTGLSPPEPPFSFAAYVDADIPFYHIMPKSSLLSLETVSEIETISQVDLRKGVCEDMSLRELKPVGCVVCDWMLADTILRPCNHVFCGECIRLKMETLNGTLCRACGKLSSHQIQFSGPMEKPQKRLVGPSAEDAQIPAFPIGIMGRREERESVVKGFVSSIRQSATSAAMDSLAEAISQQVTVTRAPCEADGIITSGPHYNPHGRLPDDGKTLLQIAAEQGKTDVVEFLLRMNRNTAADAVAALELAAAAGHLDAVKLLAEPSSRHKPKFGDAEAMWRKDALECAAESGQSDVVDYLLQIGYGPRKRATRKSALHLATENGHSVVVRLLLDGGFDPNATIKETPRHLAHFSDCRANDYESNSELTPANLAARKGYTDILRLLRGHGANMDVPSGHNGYRPIHEAASEGKVEAVRYLMGIGVSVTAGSGGSSLLLPLVWAAKGNHVEVARLLIPSSETEHLCHAAQYAVEHGSADVLDMLLECGGSANAEGWWGGRSLLHIATSSKSSSARAIEVLLRHGADISSSWKLERSEVAMMAIHRSIENDNRVAFEALVSAGANIHNELEDGRSCLHLAARQGAVDIGRRLLDEGIDPNHRAHAAEHATPLAAALLAHKPDFVSLLLSRGAVVRDLKLLRQLILSRSGCRQWTTDAFKCAVVVFPCFRPLLCPVGAGGRAKLARGLGDFVVAAFEDPVCNVETALEVLAQARALLPHSVDCRVVKVVLSNIGRRNALTRVDAVMRLLPRETCRAVGAAFRQGTPFNEKLASYVVKRYGSLEDVDGVGKG